MSRSNWFENLVLFLFGVFVSIDWTTSCADEIPKRVHVVGQFAFFDGEYKFEYWRDGGDILLELHLSQGVKEAIAIENGTLFHFSKVPMAKKFSLVSTFPIVKYSHEEFSKQIGGLSASTYLSFADPEWFLAKRIENEIELGAKVKELPSVDGKRQSILNPDGKQSITTWLDLENRINRVDIVTREQSKIRVDLKYGERGLVSFEETRPGGIGRKATYLSRDHESPLTIDLAKYDFAMSKFPIPFTLALIATPVFIYALALLWNRNHRRRLSRQSKGFTVVELLVVIGVLAILIGMILPAIGAAREAGRVAKCKSNIRQLAMGVTQFRSTQREFPSCGWGSRWFALNDMGIKQDQPGGWYYRISSFVEIDSVFVHPSSLDIQKFSAFDYNEIASKRIPVFHCPSKPDRYVDVRRISVEMAHGVLIGKCQKPDYAMSLGPWRSGDFLSSPYGPMNLDERLTYKWPNDNWLGIAKRHVGRKENEVLDGESMTILLGEKRIDRYMTLRAGDDQPYWTGCGKDTCRWSDYLGRDFDFFWGPMTGFGSSHLDFTVFARCDNSIHAESNDIDPKVLAQLGDIADGQ
jgi:hypothetical protein